MVKLKGTINGKIIRILAWRLPLLRGRGNAARNIRTLGLSVNQPEKSVMF
jgi:hypothetical protein